MVTTSSTSDPIPIAQGDVGSVYTFTFKDAQGNLVDLTGYTVTLKYWPYPLATPTTTHVLTVVNPATNGQAQWTLVSGDTATLGDYQANIVFTANGYQETVPVYSFYFTIVKVVS